MEIRVFGFVVLCTLVTAAAAVACPDPRYRAGIYSHDFLSLKEVAHVGDLATEIGSTNIARDEVLTAYAEYKLARQRVRSSGNSNDDHFEAMRQFYDRNALLTVVQQRMSLFRGAPATSLHAHSGNSMFVNAKNRFRTMGTPQHFSTMTGGFNRAWSDC